VTRRPILGLTACTRQLGAEPAQAVINRYVEAAARFADCVPLLIPARPDLVDADSVAARLDGLLLTGSPSNVAPAHYGVADPGSAPFDHGRDAMSLALIEAMRARGLPVFGICRGFQELNVACGGTLARDLADPSRPLPHHAPDDVPLDAMFDHGHDVDLNPHGLLARGLGDTRLRVNSVHYQGVDRLGDGLVVEATAPDGVIEAFSSRPGDPPLLAVQWHPEWHTDADPASRTIFALLGRALRGEPLMLSEGETLEQA
jgi:putative glutamine amidotransferase